MAVKVTGNQAWDEAKPELFSERRENENNSCSDDPMNSTLGFWDKRTSRQNINTGNTGGWSDASQSCHQVKEMGL